MGSPLYSGEKCHIKHGDYKWKQAQKIPSFQEMKGKGGICFDSCDGKALCK